MKPLTPTYLPKLPYAVTLLVSLIISFTACEPVDSSSSRAQEEIREILMRQQENWNKGDLRAFMDGYWKSDSLMFIGAETITYGYEATLNRYLTRYDTPEKRGKLKFEIDELKNISENVCFTVGTFYLSRPDLPEDLSGRFTLLWKKIQGEWVIIADHTE